jgi:hypothetical protein
MIHFNNKMYLKYKQLAIEFLEMQIHTMGLMLHTWLFHKHIMPRKKKE